MSNVAAKTISLGLIGGGFMGEAIVDGLVSSGAARTQDLAVDELAPERREHLKKRFKGLLVTSDATEAAKNRDIVLIAVKPQDMAKAAAVLHGVLQPEQVVMSIMAGVRIASLTSALDHSRVVRVMPNTPASLGAGFSAWMATGDVTDEQLTLVRRVLSALGHEAQFSEERYLDMATALSGSGPAYVFFFLEALIDAGVHIGIPRALATDMAIQTILGSMKMAVALERHPAELRNMVTSPAGTTAEALLVLERAGVRAALTDAVVAAYEKSRALGG